MVVSVSYLVLRQKGDNETLYNEALYSQNSASSLCVCVCVCVCVCGGGGGGNFLYIA